jgi:hypothetical protein
VIPPRHESSVGTELCVCVCSKNLVVSRPQQLILVHASVYICRAVACFSEERSLLHQLGLFQALRSPAIEPNPTRSHLNSFKQRER